MRKSLILKLIIVLVVLAISAMSYKIYTKQLDKNRYTTISMPAFQFTNNNGSLSNQTNVKHNVPVLFIYVSPYCETCTSLLTEIRKIDNKNNLDLWIVSTDKPGAEKIKELYPDLNNYVYSEKREGDFQTYFGSSSLSSVYIFDRQHKLKKHYVGSISPLTFL